MPRFDHRYRDARNHRSRCVEPRNSQEIVNAVKLSMASVSPPHRCPGVRSFSMVELCARGTRGNPCEGVARLGFAGRPTVQLTLCSDPILPIIAVAPTARFKFLIGLFRDVLVGRLMPLSGGQSYDRLGWTYVMMRIVLRHVALLRLPQQPALSTT